MTRINFAVSRHTLRLGIFLFLFAASVSAQDVTATRLDSLEGGGLTTLSSASQITDNLTAARNSLSRLIPAEVADVAQHPQQPDPNATPRQTGQPYVFPTHTERFKRFLKNTVGPLRLARTAASAAIDQWRDHPEEWEQGSKGYAKRFASNFGKNAIHQSVTYGLDEALHLDTGFRRSTRTGFWPRATDALLENVTSRNRDGKRVVSVPRFAGIYAGAIISYETWYPSRYDYKDGLRSGTQTLLIDFGLNLVREFLVKF